MVKCSSVKWLAIGMAWAGCGGLTAVAQAATISATGDYKLGAGAVVNVPPFVSPTYVDVLSFPSSGTDSAGLHTYGMTSGNFGSRSSGMGVYVANGTFNITEVFNNPNPTPMAATMNFNIIPGMLMNNLNAPLIGPEFVNANISFDIQVNAVSVWNSAATLGSTSSGTSFSSTGAALYTMSSSTYYVITGGAFSVSLGSIAANSSITMSYTLSTQASGNTGTGSSVWIPPQTVTVPGQWVNDCRGQGAAGGVRDCVQTWQAASTTTIAGHWTSGTVSASHANSGDPFHIDASTGDPLYLPRLPADNDHYGFQLSLAPVPEPASIALMLGGLGLLGWRLRRRGEMDLALA